MEASRLATQFLAGLDKVVDSTRPDFDIRAVDLVDAVRDPVDDQGFESWVPKGAVELVGFCVDRFERFSWRRFLDGNCEAGGVRSLPVVCGELQYVRSRRREFRGCDQRFGIGEGHLARSGLFAPCGSCSRAGGWRRRRRRVAITSGLAIDIRRIPI